MDFDFDFEFDLAVMIPAAIIYVLVAVGMFYMYRFWDSQGMEIGFMIYIASAVVLIPLTYFITLYFHNKG